MAELIKTDKGKMGWKGWLLLATSCLAGVSIGAYVIQSKYANVGRQTTRNITRFLESTGAAISGDTISGGIVNEPMKVNTAVNATVISLINAYTEQSGGEAPTANQPKTPKQTTIATPAPAPAVVNEEKTPPSHLPKLSELPDDGGYAESEMKGRRGNKTVQKWDPDDFSPKGDKPSDDTDLFSLPDEN
jgi:hypothetical protein